MRRFQCAFNWINFSFITQSLKTNHIHITRQALSPGREQKPNYFITILNYSISSRLADDHNIVWGHHGKKYSSAKSSRSHYRVLSGDVHTPGEGQQVFFFPFRPETQVQKKSRRRHTPQVPIAVSWPTSASQGSVIFLESLSEKQMTDAFC